MLAESLNRHRMTSEPYQPRCRQQQPTGEVVAESLRISQSRIAPNRREELVARMSQQEMTDLVSQREPLAGEGLIDVQRDHDPLAGHLGARVMQSERTSSDLRASEVSSDCRQLHGNTRRCPRIEQKLDDDPIQLSLGVLPPGMSVEPAGFDPHSRSPRAHAIHQSGPLNADIGTTPPGPACASAAVDQSIRMRLADQPFSSPATSSASKLSVAAPEAPPRARGSSRNCSSAARRVAERVVKRIACKVPRDVFLADHACYRCDALLRLVVQCSPRTSARPMRPSSA